jgi:protein TonB
MAERAKAPAAATGVADTANDRFKRSFGNWFWGSVVAATVIHFVVFAFWPAMRAADYSFEAAQIEMIDLPPEIEIPPPPEQIARPATPIIGSAEIDQDITIAATTFEATPIENLPPPPAGATSDDISRAPVFTPYTVAPRLRNTQAVERALQRNYPPLLRDAGIGGSVNVWFFIDEDGKVLRTQLHQSSGYEALDQAAIQVANIMEFSPAFNRDKRVQVWVSIPITFSSR